MWCKACEPADPTTDTVRIGALSALSKAGESGFAGAWGKRRIDEGCTTLTWNSGEQSPIEVDGNNITLESDGQVFHGVLEGSCIRWSDGDIWERKEEEGNVVEVDADSSDDAEQRNQEKETAGQEDLADEEETEPRRAEEAEEEERAARRLQEDLQREAEELARRQQEEEELEQTRQAEEQERKAAVGSFLKENKFKDAMTPRKSMMSTTYPLHVAAKKGDEQMVQLLIEEGANPATKDSSGKTALEAAQKAGKNGSHDAVLLALQGGA